ncbi:MAG: demethylmenaquinone methyltransferase [Sporomusaceae bacterium]|nr:demethylmenaquinone methyltransferase [Sporomusaceae bacterium]
MEQFDGVSKQEYVHEVFTTIASKYDLLNSALSFNQDKYWRRFAVEKANLCPGDLTLDVACGTGMLALEQAKTMGTGQIVGFDFCQNMLDKAAENIAATDYAPMIKLLQGNAMELPFPDNTFKAVTIGFGLRNMPDYKQVIAEMVRVVKPGGRVVSLELAKPSMPGFKQLYYFYFEQVLPFLGKLGIGQEGPYRWLPESLKLYPHQQIVKESFIAAGLADACCYELTGGIVAVHAGTKGACLAK